MCNTLLPMGVEVAVQHNPQQGKSFINSESGLRSNKKEHSVVMQVDNAAA